MQGRFDCQRKNPLLRGGEKIYILKDAEGRSHEHAPTDFHSQSGYFYIGGYYNL